MSIHVKSPVLTLISALFFFMAVRVEAEGSEAALQSFVSGVKSYTLPNGLKVLMYKRGTAPVFAGAVVIRVGGSDESTGQTGISHLFEHMAFKGTTSVGTRDYTKEQRLLEELEVLAAQSDGGQKLNSEQAKRWADILNELRALWIPDDFTRQYEKRGAVGMNATTDTELTKYFVNLPISALEFWCRMEVDRIMNPVLRQFYQERDVVLEERRMRFEDDPMGKLYELLLGVAYTQHPYRRPVIGYQQDIGALTARELEGFRRRYYVPSNMAVALVGAIEPERDLETITRCFEQLPSAAPPERPAVVEPEQRGERRVSLRSEAAPQFMISYHKPNYPNPDDAPLTVMAEILAGSRISPLYQELVKRKRILAEISVDEIPGVAYPNLLTFFGTVKNPHDIDEAIRAFDAVISRFTRTGPTEAQLEMAKKAIRMSYLSRLDSNEEIAVDLASSQLVFGDWRTVATWYDEMESVTVKDVMRVATQYLNPDRRTIGGIDRS